MHKGMIPALIACFFGAALAAACDPELLSRPFEVTPTVSDSAYVPRPCGEVKSQDACSSLVMCVWTDSRCKERDLTLP